MKQIKSITNNVKADSIPRYIYNYVDGVDSVPLFNNGLPSNIHIKMCCRIPIDPYYITSEYAHNRESNKLQTLVDSINGLNKFSDRKSEWSKLWNIITISNLTPMHRIPLSYMRTYTPKCNVFIDIDANILYYRLSTSTGNIFLSLDLANYTDYPVFKYTTLSSSNINAIAKNSVLFEVKKH